MVRGKFEELRQQLRDFFKYWFPDLMTKLRGRI